MRRFLLLTGLLMTTTGHASTQATPASAAPAPTGTPAPAAAAPACSSAAHRQFDFWLGEWEVTGQAGQVVGHSRIERLLGGCVIAEHWTSARGGGANDGKSFNLFNAQAGHWEQFWVDAQGKRLLLEGGLVDGAMVLTGIQMQADAATGIARRERITWTPNADASVRQRWESSTDEGKTWTVAFDGLYRRAVK